MEERFINIENYEKSISEIYVNQNLKCLRGLDDAYELDGRNILKWYSEVPKKVELNLSYFNFGIFWMIYVSFQMR